MSTLTGSGGRGERCGTEGGGEAVALVDKLLPLQHWRCSVRVTEIEGWREGEREGGARGGVWVRV